MLHSIVEYYAEHESYKCGYCKRPDTNYSHGMWAHTMTVSDYQDLIDRGWRRSGNYCYKPTMNVTCCPMYTIRCRATEFKPTKSQKKVMKKLNKYLMGHDVTEKLLNCSERKMSTCSSEMSEELAAGEGGQEQFIETKKQHQSIDISKVGAVKPVEVSNCQGGGLQKVENLTSSSSTHTEVTKHDSIAKVAGPDPNRSPCKKAKQLRRERKLEKLKEKGVDISTVASNNMTKERQLEEFIQESSGQVLKKLEIRLVRTNPPSPEWLATARQTYELFVKYQTVIHGDRPEKCTESKFRDFLVHSPLLEERSETGPPCGYGSFHQQYWLNGSLVAVGVIDILPRCVSSVYFFYDPQYTYLTLGTYGALREIAFTRHLNSLAPELRYYYMGYYIHSCPKMRYKGNFRPSDLLCPETYNWFPIQNCIEKLEVAAYSRLDPDPNSVDENNPNDTDINYIPVLVKDAVLLYIQYKRKFAKSLDDGDDLSQYAKLVGAKTAKSLILVR